MHARRIAITLGALVLSFGLAGSASAAPSIEVTYDLSASTAGEGGTLLWATSPDFADANLSNPVNITVSDMTVVYNGTIGSIQPGTATIQSLYLAWSGTLYYRNASVTPRSEPGFGSLGNWKPRTFPNGTLAGGVTLRLTAPVQGSLTPNGLLTANASFYWRAVVQTQDGDYSFTGYPALVVTPINLALPVGSYGGKHWVDGRQSGGATTVGGSTSYGAGYFTNGTGTLYNGSLAGPTMMFQTRVNNKSGTVPAEVTLVGREISRVPEPGSLLLLGSGLAGLAALGGTGTVGHQLRRRRRS